MQQVLQEVRSSTSASFQSNTANGHFIKCTSRFAGKKEDNVQAFIDAINMFNECVCVSEENALRGLPILLTESAATWLQGLKDAIFTWDLALTALRSAYGSNKPAHEIYRELFASEQGEDTPTDIFVSKARCPFAKLKEKLTESMQVDMIYGLFNRSYSILHALCSTTRAKPQDSCP